jgi:hypothetical protein
LQGRRVEQQFLGQGNPPDDPIFALSDRQSPKRDTLPSLP